METHPISTSTSPRHLLHAERRLLRADRGAGARGGHRVVVGKVQYGAVGAGTVYGDRGGLIKVVGDKKYGELVGGHIVGAKATELIQELVNAKALEGGYAEVAGSSTATRRCRRASWRLPVPPTAGSSTAEPQQPRFYYDFASPESYLVAERALHALGEVPEWIPVGVGSLVSAARRKSRATRRTSSGGRRSSA